MGTLNVIEPDAMGQPMLPPLFSKYPLDTALDEMLDFDGRPRLHYQQLLRMMNVTSSSSRFSPNSSR